MNRLRLLTFLVIVCAFLAACGGGAAITPAEGDDGEVATDELEEPTEEPTEDEGDGGDGGGDDEEGEVVMHLRMDVTAPQDLAGTYETDVRNATCAFGMQEENDFYANPGGTTDDGELYGVTLQVLDLAQPERADVLVNIGDDNYYVDESNGSADLTIDDQGDTASVTGSVEAVPLLDATADPLEFTIDLD